MEERSEPALCLTLENDRGSAVTEKTKLKNKEREKEKEKEKKLSRFGEKKYENSALAIFFCSDCSECSFLKPVQRSIDGNHVFLDLRYLETLRFLFLFFPLPPASRPSSSKSTARNTP